MKKQINSYGISNFTNAYIESNDVEMSLIHYILSDKINLGGQKFDLNGYKDDYTPKRPKVLFNHGLDGINGFTEPTDPRITFLYLIGRNEWIVTANGMLRAKTIFKKDNELAVDLYNAYKSKDWTDWSVRWAFTETNGQIDANAYEEQEEVLFIKSYWFREYSACFEGKDTEAITSLMNNMGSYKSDIFKNFISNKHLNSQAQNSEELTNLQLELTELKSQFENKNGEAVEYTNEAITKAVQLLKPRLLEISDNINKLSEITLTNEQTLSNIDSIIESKVNKCVTGVISRTLGQV